MTAVRTFGVLTILAFASACERGATATAQATQPTATAATTADHSARATATRAATGTADLQLTVDGTGYHPSSISAPSGKPVRLTITRTSDEGCGQQIVFPSLNIRRDLPLNEAVTVEFTMPASGSVAFTCGMDMLRGSIVAG
jgi:plastocyanin domain-containing protein